MLSFASNTNLVIKRVSVPAGPSPASRWVTADGARAFAIYCRDLANYSTMNWFPRNRANL